MKSPKLSMTSNRVNLKPFINGFLKGFTAPLRLFNRMDAPTIPAVKEISVSDIGSDQGINGYFIKVGGDMRKALSKYFDNELGGKS